MNTPSLGLLQVLTALLLGLVLFAVSAHAESPRQTPQTQSDIFLSFAPVVKKAQPALVNVYASRTDKRPRNPLFNDPIFRRFFGEGGNSRPGGPTARSLGSGVLVDASGLVVTNYHVIEGMTDVKIALADKREFDAGIVLRDQRTDLVVLRLTGGENFPVMELGNSDGLEIGDIVLAIGNPFGVGQTVTQGIVGAGAHPGWNIRLRYFKPTPRSIRAIRAAPSSICGQGSSASIPRSFRKPEVRSGSDSQSPSIW